MKWTFLASTVCLVTGLWTSTSYAQSPQSDLRELYNLCSRFPFNSRCQGLDIPIPLDQRSGTTVDCSFKFDIPDRSSEKCKIIVTDEDVTLYLEAGPSIDFLDNKPGTQEIIIPRANITAFNLRFWDRGRDTTSFLFGGTLYILQDEDYEDFEQNFDPAANSDERTAIGDEDFAEVEISFLVTSPDASENRSNVLEIKASEEYGDFLRGQITPSLTASPESMVGDQLRPVSTNAAVEDQSAQIRQLLDTQECVRCDLQGADLRGADLEDANLEGANLQGANLQGANLEESYLIGANLDGAVLTGADLSGARLALSSLVETTLDEANLEVANLQRVNLQGANLRNAQLGGANLDGANLANATLEGADLSDITTSNFVVFLGLQRFKLYTSLRDANLTRANLSNVNLEDAQLDNANLSGANLSGANLDDADLTGSNLCNATLADGSTSNQGC